MKIALITGAFNGIGLELVKVHTSKDDNLFLVARNKSKLNDIKIEFEKSIKFIKLILLLAPLNF